MSSKKKPAVPNMFQHSAKRRSRRPARSRSSYEVTADHARARLQKAKEEHAACLTKLEGLSRQIPWLENLVLALTPIEDQLKHVAPTPPFVNPETIPGVVSASQYAPPVQPPPAAAETVDQAQFLQRFMPRPTRTTTNMAPTPMRQQPGNADDPDEFLRDVDIPGRDLLT